MHKRILRSCLFVLSFVILNTGFGQNWLSGFEYRKPVTISSADISGTGTLSDFPVLVSITSTDLNNATGHVTSSNGYDIAFSDADGGTAAPFQLVSFDDVNGIIVAWVKLDLDGTNGNTFYIYYGDSDVTTNQSSSATWKSNYLGVWTLDESTTTFSDLTVNNNDFSDNGGSADVTGKIGNAQNFDGVDDWLQVDDNASLRNLTNAFTFSAWVKLDGPQANDYGIIIKNENGTYYQHMGIESTEKPSWRVRTGGATTTRDNDDININVDDGAWHHFVGVYDGSNMIFYVDSVQQDVVAKTGNVDTNSEPLLMGRRAIGDNRFYDGSIDEPRYLNEGLSAEWVGTEFHNQDDAASFVSAGTEESITPVDGGTATPAEVEVFSGNTTSFSLINYSASGTTLQWQSSTDGTTFSNVTGGSGATTDFYVTEALTVDTYFRCLVTDGGQARTVASTISLATIKPSFNSGEGPAGYSLRRKLTIDNTEVSGSSDHTNFPVLIRLTGTKSISDLIYLGNGGDVAHSSGYDIIFTSSDGTTVVDHQIEQYDPVTGEYVAWVMVPTLSYNSDTDLYIYYGNPDVTTDPSINIFDTDYEGVWHLHDGFDDATSSANDGVSFSSVANAGGIIAEAADFSPANGNDFSRIEIGTFDPDPSNITVSAWLNRSVTNNGATDGRIISKSDGQATDDHVFMASIVNGNDLRLRLTGTEADDTGPVTTTQAQNVNFNPGDWVYYAFTWTPNGNILAYENGVQVGSHNNLNAKEKIEQNTGFRVALGNNPGPADGGDPSTRKPFDGLIDEVRVANVARSADWLLTEFNNQQENSGFCTIAEEEGCNVSGGVASATSMNIFTGEQTSLSVTDTVGSSLQWQSSTDNVTFADIGGATNRTYNTPALSQTTYYRVVVKDGTCSAVSNTVTVIVEGMFLTNYAYRKSIIIDKDQIAGNTALTDFPLLISITDNDLRTTANGGNVFDTDAGNGTLGDDITFTDFSGNELSLYREEYDDVSGLLVTWVKIPTISATQDTEIFIYYGNCTGSGLPNLFNTDTWSAEYEAVWLMNDATPTTITDATSNGRDGTGTGLTASPNGQISDAVDLESGDTSDKMTYSSYTTAGSALTVSAWINPESLLNPNVGGDTDDAIILSHSDFVLKTFVDNLNPDENQFQWEVTTTGTVGINTLPSDLATGSFIMVTGVYDGTNISIYENGNFIASAAQTGGLAGTNSDIVVGNNAGNTLPFDGVMDQVFISNAAQSSDWIKTTYNNQNDPSSFYSYDTGNEETQVGWIGGASGAETDFNDPANWANCQVPGASENIILSGDLTFYPTLTANATINDLILLSGTTTDASYDLGGDTLTIRGRLTNNGTFTHSNGTVIFTGSSEQYISGDNPITLYNVEISNGANHLQIQNETTVENILKLTSGFITINDDKLILGPNASIDGGSSTSYVVTEGLQCLEQQDLGSTGRTGDVLFPVGSTTSSYTPVTLNNTSGTDDDYCVRVVDEIYSEGFINSGTRLTSDVIDKTWFVNETVEGESNITMTLQWNAEDELFGFDRTNMFLSHYKGSGWLPHATGISASNPSMDVYTASVSGVTEFSPQGGGSGGSPLPIELIGFEGDYRDGKVQLSWSTSQEINNEFFTLYRSLDGNEFEEIGRVDGGGNSASRRDYSFNDYIETDGIVFYQLSQTDFDGRNEFFPVISVVTAPDSFLRLIRVYPNPAIETVNLTVTGLQPGATAEIRLTDLAGRLIRTYEHELSSRGVINRTLDLTGLQGVYIIKVMTETQRLESKLILQR